MATAGSQQAKSPVAIVPPSPRSPLAGPRDHDLAMLALDDTGMIRDCGEACEAVFGYQKGELAGHHVSALLPQLGETELVAEDRIHPRLAFLSRCGMPFRARHRNGRSFDIELFINRLGSHNVVVLARCLHKAAA